MKPAEHKGVRGQVPVSVVVLTRNEALNIKECLRSVAWAGEVFIVDSLSDDGTVEIAKATGAQTFLHAFEGYAAQRNWALGNLPFSNEWVLMLDADERVPAALAAEMDDVVRNDGNRCTGFYLRRRFVFLGRWLRHGGLYATWILRLFKRECVRFEQRPVNENAILDGEAAYLQNSLDHVDHRGLSDWVAKHNRYSDLQSEEYVQETLGGGYDDSVRARYWGTQVERKRWIKLRLWNRCPLLIRPFLLFLWNYFLKAGFLDGRAGFIYHVLWSFWYQFLVSTKIIERDEAVKSGSSTEPAYLQVPDGSNRSTRKAGAVETE